MIQRIVAGLMLVLFLAACGSSPQSATTEPTATPAVEPTEAPAVVEPTEAVAATEPTEATQSDGTSTAQRYVIVPTESEVRYEVAETFLRDNRLATAIGVTQEIEGTITVDPACTIAVNAPQMPNVLKTSIRRMARVVCRSST